MHSGVRSLFAFSVLLHIFCLNLVLVIAKTLVILQTKKKLLQTKTLVYIKPILQTL